ncbi:zinc ABC transporter substrate-binding protein [Nitrosopumilus sp.]|nr:zinc ABC transporter substrate-binding protein [Nitrosopumilus sp.]MDB4850260.1 zinc ABC transporter substrate-binding protein [Nitrosopumilus sp.]
MKKLLLTGTIVIVAILIGFSALLIQNNDDVKINDIERSNIYSEKITITTTTNVITDLVENIGGDYVSVIGLMGPGVDPHLYRPSASDVKALQNADIIFYNGLDLEGKMGDIFVKIGRDGTSVLAVSENIPHESLLILDTNGNFDPHIWWNVELWTEAAKVVATALKQYDPKNSEKYDNNLLEYLNQLDTLNSNNLNKINSIPPEQRVLVTAHDAFQYFGHAYGFEELAIQGWSTDSEAGIREIQNLADEISKREIKALFVETSISPATIEALKAAVQDRGHDIVIGGELFSDAIGEKGTTKGTYIGAFTHNIDTIVKALK